jgi:hypothetical protein
LQARESKEVKLQRVADFWRFIADTHRIEVSCFQSCSDIIWPGQFGPLHTLLQSVATKSPIKIDLDVSLVQCKSKRGPDAALCLRSVRNSLLTLVDDSMGPVYSPNWQVGEMGFQKHCSNCHRLQSGDKIEYEVEKLLAGSTFLHFRDAARTSSNDPIGYYALMFSGHKSVGVPAFSSLIDNDELWSISFFLASQITLTRMKSCPKLAPAMDLRTLLFLSDQELSEKLGGQNSSCSLAYLRRSLSFDPATPRSIASVSRIEKSSRAIKILGIVFFTTFLLFFAILRRRQ